MKVLLIGNYPPDQQYSMQGFANALLTGLSGLEVDVRMIAPHAAVGRLHMPNLSKWLGYADKFLVFPSQLRRAVREADIVHICDHSNAIYTKYLTGKPHLVTCHDMLAIRSAFGDIPEHHTRVLGRIYQRMILKGLTRAQHIACDSVASCQDLQRMGRIPSSRVDVINIGLLSEIEPMPASQSAITLKALNIDENEPYLLHVGGNQFYKNRIGLLQIYKALVCRDDFPSMRLVMAGHEFTVEMREYIDKHRLKNRIVELVGLDDEQIRALYSGAKALIYPSLYEGFGLPIIEAQACGCPVFTSIRAPMTEVGGDAAIYFDPMVPELAADIISSHLRSTNDMVTSGFKNIRRFSTAQMLQNYLAIYEKLIGKKNNIV